MDEVVQVRGKMSGKCIVEWICKECEGEPHFTHDEMMKHLTDVHGVDIKQPAESRMISHFDAREYFSSTYELTVNGMKFIKMVQCERDEDDIMRIV